MKSVRAASIFEGLLYPRAAARVPDALCGLAYASRFLLLAVAVLYAVAPWTEWFWNWDGFARGGQDTELGLMALVAVLCLGCAVMGRAHQLAWRLLCNWNTKDAAHGLTHARRGCEPHRAGSGMVWEPGDASARGTPLRI